MSGAISQTVDRARAAAATARTIARRAGAVIERGRVASTQAETGGDGYLRLPAGDECDWLGERPQTTAAVHGVVHCSAADLVGRFYIEMDEDEIVAWRGDAIRIEYHMGSTITPDASFEFGVIRHEGRTFAGEIRHDGELRLGELTSATGAVYSGQFRDLPERLDVDPDGVPLWLSLLMQRHGLGAVRDGEGEITYAGPWHLDERTGE
jgi:hypothetical protein